MAELTADIVAPLVHPCYEGHFPGNPVVPGVLLIELVIEAIGRGAPRVIGAVKFVRPIAPGESFTLRWNPEGARVAFHCARDAQPIAEGLLTFGNGP